MHHLIVYYGTYIVDENNMNNNIVVGGILSKLRINQGFYLWWI